MTGGDAPPMVTVEALAIHAHDDGYVLEILALNKGGETAAQVVVEGELRRGGESVATSQTTFDYVPRQSQRRGGLFFSENPQRLRRERARAGIYPALTKIARTAGRYVSSSSASATPASSSQRWPVMPQPNCS